MANGHSFNLCQKVTSCLPLLRSFFHSRVLFWQRSGAKKKERGEKSSRDPSPSRSHFPISTFLPLPSSFCLPRGLQRSRVVERRKERTFAFFQSLSFGAASPSFGTQASRLFFLSPFLPFLSFAGNPRGSRCETRQRKNKQCSSQKKKLCIHRMPKEEAGLLISGWILKVH